MLGWWRVPQGPGIFDMRRASATFCALIIGGSLKSQGLQSSQTETHGRAGGRRRQEDGVSGGVGRRWDTREEMAERAVGSQGSELGHGQQDSSVLAELGGVWT